MVKINKSDVPMGIKIIAVLLGIYSLLNIFFSLILMMLILFGPPDFGLGSNPGLLEEFDLISFGLFFISLLIMVFFIFIILISIKLWKGKNWARIIIIVLFVLNFLLAIVSLFLSLFAYKNLDFFIALVFNVTYLSVSGFIVYYLIFNKKVKEAFKK